MDIHLTILLSIIQSDWISVRQQAPPPCSRTEQYGSLYMASLRGNLGGGVKKGEKGIGKWCIKCNLQIRNKHGRCQVRRCEGKHKKSLLKWINETNEKRYTETDLTSSYLCNKCYNEFYYKVKSKYEDQENEASAEPRPGTSSAEGGPERSLPEGLYHVIFQYVNRTFTYLK